MKRPNKKKPKKDYYKIADLVLKIIATIFLFLNYFKGKL